MKNEGNSKNYIWWIVTILIILIVLLVVMKLFENKNKPNNLKTNDKETNQEKETAKNNKIEEFPLDKDVKELYDSKTIVINSSKEQKIKNINIYKEFKELVDKKENASFRYVSPTMEGDTIITDIYYDKDKGFEIITDSRRDQFGKKEIEKDNYKYIYELEKNIGQVENSENSIHVIFSNKESEELALADSTLDTYHLFTYTKQNKE